MNKKRLLITIIVLLIALIIGIVFITAGRQKPAVLDSKIQMTAFNAGLEPKEHAPGYGTTYEIFVYSFCDSDGDGIGDINGIRSKLDYIEDLGFDAIWLTPIHPSPTYHKYDVTDYFTIDPVFGTLEDYEALIAECHERGISVIMDMVLNHTSTEHGWFKEASDYLRELPDDWEPDSSYCQYFDYYNFSRESKEGYAPLEGTNWYYEARFWSGMPDLNLSSTKVRDEVGYILDFWIKKGVDGFRLDAVTSYWTGDPDGNVNFLRFFCDTARSIDPDTYIVGEAWTDRANIAILYSSGIDSLFNFPFAGQEGIICNILRGSNSASDYVKALNSSDDAYRSANPSYIDAPFYTNHDMARSAGYYALDQGPQTKMSYALSLLMSGNSYVYYGEEIGMKGSGKDENKRAPMYWSDDPDDPDVCAGPPDMDEVKLKFPSLKDQQEDELSIYSWFKQVIKVRNAFPAISMGKARLDETVSGDTVAAFFKECNGEDPVYIVINLSEETKTLSIAPDGMELSAVLNTNEEKIVFENGTLTLPSYSIAIFS